MVTGVGGEPIEQVGGSFVHPVAVLHLKQHRPPERLVEQAADEISRSILKEAGLDGRLSGRRRHFHHGNFRHQRKQ